MKWVYGIVKMDIIRTVMKFPIRAGMMTLIHDTSQNPISAVALFTEIKAVVILSGSIIHVQFLKA